MTQHELYDVLIEAEEDEDFERETLAEYYQIAYERQPEPDSTIGEIASDLYVWCKVYNRQQEAAR